MGKNFYNRSKKRDRSEGNDREGQESGDKRKCFEERHKGSFPLENLKLSDDYSRRCSIFGPKKKYAVCLGYIGTNYQGLQINPDAITVEAWLERALFLSGAIQECNYGNLQKIQWTRAARTDRGVHAVTQCCAMRITMSPNGTDSLVNSVNSFLPPDIRVHTMTKVSKGFNAKNMCSKRMYHYLLPTYILSDPKRMASLLSQEYECQGPRTGAGYEGGYADPNSSVFLGSDGLRRVYDQVKDFRASSETLQLFRDGLRHFQGTHGFHNFTTGLTAKDATSQRYIISFDCSDPWVVESTGIEWVRLSVLGQSFLLNQIRRMVAMAVDVGRGVATLADIDTALSDKRVEIPMVPGLGLYLDQLYFDIYDLKIDHEQKKTKKANVEEIESDNKLVRSEGDVCDDNEDGNKTVEEDGVAKEDMEKESPEDEKENDLHEKLDWASKNENLRKFKEFKDNILYPHIYEEDQKSLPFLYYLDFLRVYKHDYVPKPNKDT